MCGLKLRVESKMTPRFLTSGEYGIIVSLQMMGEGVHSGVILYSICKNRAYVFLGLNESELLDSHLLLCLSRKILCLGIRWKFSGRLEIMSSKGRI